ncbi:hypothetical protein VTO73DRAFT_4541 [Trametes versicolor]
MPRAPLHHIQADAASIAEFLTYASAILDSSAVLEREDDADLLDQDDDEVEDWMMDDRSTVEILHHPTVGSDISSVAILSTNPIFISSGRKPQHHVKYQLGTFLFRYGRLGTDSLEVAAKLGIGHGHFTSYEISWPGSVPDARVFKTSDVWVNRHKYFRPGEYIMVDKGYMSTPYTVRPFDEAEIGRAQAADRKHMQQFNKRLSSVRIISEHAYGRLKGRFPGLKALGTHHDINDCYKAIVALLVLHNICLDLNDQPEDIFDFDARDTPPGVPEEEEEEQREGYETPPLPPQGRK